MLGDTLRELRQDAGLTQCEFASLLCVSQGAVGNWESGARQPDNDMLIRIAQYFHVSTDYLLGLTTEKAPAGDPAEASPPSREQMIDDIIRIYREMSAEEKLDFLARLNTPTAP